MEENRVSSMVYKFKLYVLPFLFLLLFSGCTKIQLIASYDEETDTAITQLQRKFETFFVELEDDVGTQKAAYENHNQFYKTLRVDISAIKLRVAAQPRNEITLEQVELLEDNVDLLIQLHRGGIDSIELVDIARGNFNTALTNILKLELAKKRGQEEVK